jgi:hypothetical protein
MRYVEKGCGGGSLPAFRRLIAAQSSLRLGLLQRLRGLLPEEETQTVNHPPAPTRKPEPAHSA